jgi:hypothetical protein
VARPHVDRLGTGCIAAGATKAAAFYFSFHIPVPTFNLAPHTPRPGTFWKE